MFKIGSVDIDTKCVLGPMAGYTDRAFREMCLDGGAGLVFTEMISCKGLIYQNKQTDNMLQTSPNQKPVAIQLFGDNPDDFYMAVQDSRLDNFDIIDINMGCPVNKIIRQGQGSQLMQTPKLAQDIIRACVKASNGRPVMAKIRLGLHFGDKLALTFAKAMQDAGAAAITVHGRYQEQLYRGNADWDAIGDIAQVLTIPTIGSGDIRTKSDYDNATKSFGVSGIMIARAAIGNPDIFDYLKGVKDIPQTKNHTMSLCKKHFELCTAYNKERATNTFKKHLAAYASRAKLGGKTKGQINLLQNTKECFEFIESYI